jgi:polyribonucleotide nucleotidyltransferase
VVRLAEFGAFVEIIPGTDGLLHISEVAEHRIKDIRDELKEGDQVLVKVLSVEGNRIRLSRKAILKEQRAKMGGGEAPPDGGGAGGEAPPDGGGDGGGESGGGGEERQERHDRPEPVEAERGAAVTFEGGSDDEAGDDEPNFNRVDGEPAPAREGGPSGPREGGFGGGRGPGGPGRGPGGGAGGGGRRPRRGGGGGGRGGPGRGPGGGGRGPGGGDRGRR